MRFLVNASRADASTFAWINKKEEARASFFREVYPTCRVSLCIAL